MNKLFVLVLSGLFVLIVSGCESALLNNNSFKEVKLGFDHKSHHLSGSIILPKKGTGPFPVVLFVQGDGAQPYDAFGYYNYLWRHLADKGIASYSWNKAGVGESTGSWLKQSMGDRADEVIAAIEVLKLRNDIAEHKIGLIGYSQGGWVLPLVAEKSDYPDFMILISGAVNWLGQGDYLTKNRLTRKGFSETQIQQALVCNQHELQALQPTSIYKEYLQYHKTAPPECKAVAGSQMSQERFEFVKLNWRSDAREGLARVQCPTLGVFGDQDINVDFAESAREYKRIFNESGNANLTIKIYPDAQHSLFKNKTIDDMRPGIWAAIKMELLGEDIFAEGYLNFVAQWVKNISEQL